jgi:hypothetical protein
MGDCIGRNFARKACLSTLVSYAPIANAGRLGYARAEIDTMVSEGVLYAEPAVDEMKA